jgi:hypothetical protein
VREHQAEPDSAATAAERATALASSPATAVDVVTAWQRSLGNRAVTRLLARQDEAEPTGPSVPQRIDREDPLIRTVLGPSLTAHGMYRWLVRFQLPHPAESDGWLIQELYQEGSSGAFQHFWECWRVNRDQREPVDQADEAGTLYDDRYVHGPGAETPDARGWHRHVGVIRFYPGPLPASFGRDTGANFYNRDAQPSGWTGQGTRHDAYAEWDYTGGRRLNGFVAYAGTSELRAGDRVTFRPRTSAGPTRLETEPEAVPQRL